MKGEQSKLKEGKIKFGPVATANYVKLHMDFKKHNRNYTVFVLNDYYKG